MNPNSPHESSGPCYSTFHKDTEARLPNGTIIAGRIEIMKEMARGGMAIVYRALDLERGGALVAFKVATGKETGVDTEERYKNDARLAASLAGDRQFVQPLGVGCLEEPPGFEGRMFLITELIEAPSLDRVTSDFSTGMPIDRVVSIAGAIARALVSLHERGIVHRDIKPGNVLLEDDSHIRLIDFGLAYATGDGWEAKSPDLTQDGHAPGTPIYMSPQQAVHERPTPAFDVYAFGALCYELISGQPPDDGMALQALIGRKCDPLRQPFSIGKMCQHTPKHIADLVDRCLSYDPSKRPTASELVDALRLQSVATTPELRLVPKAQSVIASGSRPTGDATQAELVRKEVSLPFVKRAAIQPEETPEDWAASDETRLVPRADIAVAIQTLPALPPPLQCQGTESGALTVPAGEPSARRRAALGLLVAAIVVTLLGFGLAWALTPEASTGGPEQESTDRDLGPPTPSVRAHTPTPKHKSTPEAPPQEPEPPPAFELEPEPEPEPEKRERPTPARDEASQPLEGSTREQKSSTPEPKQKPAAPKAAAPPSCREQRMEAQAARAKRKWKAVLSNTDQATCWSGATTKQVRLRVEALLQLGRYKACAREAKRSTDPAVLQWRETCFSRQMSKQSGSGAGEGE